MSTDLMKSLSELDKMLAEMKDESLSDSHASFDDASAFEEESPYCIKNGAYVKVSDDGMKAFIYLNPPREGEKFYSRNLIMDFIKENGVLAGFHESNISAIAKKHVYEREINIANGKNPVEGKDGYYEFLFDTGSKHKPAIREDGSVDYTSTAQLSNVAEGQTVAIYHPKEESEDGYDVFGRAIQAHQSHDLASLKGRCIKNDKDPNVYYAIVSGKIDYNDGHIDIKNVHEVKGDVDLVTGKVEFFGDIHISGNVSTGVLIRASRNVTIDGVVEGATIYAGGDVVIGRGMNGAGKGRIIAKGNVSAEFIELASIEAGGDVRSNSFVNANIYAGQKVIAEGSRGVVIGGEVRGLQGVEVVNAGNEPAMKTLVCSGYSAKDYENYLVSVRQEVDAQKQLAETVEGLTELIKKKRLGNNFNSDFIDKEIMTLNEKKDEQFERLDRIRTDKEKYGLIIQKGKNSYVLVNNKIYSGVILGIEGAVKEIEHSTNTMKYRNDGGRVIGDVLIF